MNSTIFFFDIETIPDDDVVKNLLNFTGEREENRQALDDYHLKITDGKNKFHRQLFHKVACISFVEVESKIIDGYESYQIKDIRSGGEVENYNEEKLISGFFSYLDKIQKKTKLKIVGFNSRTFDLPVLKYRAIKYGVSASWLYEGNKYGYRYNTDWHCDLLEVLSDFGTSARIKLSEICAILDIPCKYDIDGSDVMGLFDQGDLQSIRDYCEIDAVVVYLVFLKQSLHSGKTSQDFYQKAIDEFIAYSQQTEKKNLLEFLKKFNQLNHR